VFRLTQQLRPLNEKNSFASPTPILDGDKVYVHFGADGTAALSTAGEILWKARYNYDSQHGGGGSPVLYNDLLIFNCDGNEYEAFVVALDTKTGKERWKRDRRRPAAQAYTTPLVISVNGRDQLVSVGAYRTAAYEPATGREIWRVSYADGFSNVPRPVFGKGLVLIATGFYEPSLIAVRPDGEGDVTRSHVAWRLSRGIPYTPSPLIVGDELYIVSDTGVLTVVDVSSGNVLYQARLGGNYSASPVLADGRIYFQSEEGVTTVIAPGKAFNRLAVNRLDGAMLASMAPSNGTIYIRTDSHLYRISS
jgi:outer membrane protein assembly factor BamB